MFVALTLLIDTCLSYRSNTTSTILQLAMLKVFNIISRSKSVKSENCVTIVVFVLRFLVLYCAVIYSFLSYDVASGSEITPCNKICKPLVVYRFTGNVTTSITTLRA